MTLKQKLTLFAIKYLGHRPSPNTQLLGQLLKQFGEIILISGSVGKSSTKDLLKFIYTENQVSVLSASVDFDSLWKLIIKNHNKKYEKLILETNFEHLEQITKFLQPDKLIFTNICNDEDDYNKNCILIQKSLKNLGFVEINSDTSLVLTNQKFKKIRKKNKIIETPIVIIPPKLGEDTFSLLGETLGEYFSDNLITADIAQTEIDKENHELKDKSLQNRLDMSNWFKSRKAFLEDTVKSKIRVIKTLDKQTSLVRPEIYANSDDLGLLFAFSNLDITPIGFGLGIDTELKPNFVEITDLKNVYLQQNYEGNNILTQNFATSLTVKIDKRREYLLEYNLPSVYFGYNALACFLVSYKDLGMRNLKPIKNFAPKTYKKLTYKNNPFLIIKNNNSFALKENLAIVKGNFDKAVLILGLDEAKWIWSVKLPDFLSEYSLINNKALANKSSLNVTKKQLEILGFGKKASEVLKWFKVNYASVNMEHLITNISQLGDKIDGKDVPIVFCGDENCISLLLDFMGKREE